MERQNRAFPPSSIPPSLDKPSYLPEDVIIILSFSRVNSLNSFNLSSFVTLLSHQDLLRNWDWGSPVGPSVSPPDPILQGMWGCTRSTTGPSAADTVCLPEAHKSPPFHGIWGIPHRIAHSWPAQSPPPLPVGAAIASERSARRGSSSHPADSITSTLLNHSALLCLYFSSTNCITSPLASDLSGEGWSWKSTKPSSCLGIIRLQLPPAQQVPERAAASRGISGV